MTAAIIASQMGFLAHEIGRLRVSLTDEKATQVEIARALDALRWGYQREAALSPGDRPDFLTAEGIAIEVKLRARSKMEVWRQLARYAAHDRVLGMLLVSNTAMGLPGECGGKPLGFVSLGRAWL